MNEDFELLFFDTFAQTDGHEGPNLGLVQFQTPVIIKEIRVIPLGARVEADFPGGLRLGATNPSSFELEFFMNDLSRRNACTFLDIGSLDYKQNVNIKFVPKDFIPTDGLILRGMYSTLTLSLFGCIADLSGFTAKESMESSSSIADSIPREQNSIDSIDEIQTDRTENISITENINENTDDVKMTQFLQTLTETSEDSSKRKHSPTISRKNESRASSLSSDRSDRKRKDINVENISLSSHRSRDRTQRSKRSRSPVTSLVTKRSRSRSKTKSKSRSTTPNSLKRYRYSHRTPSSPFEKSDRSPKRYHKSPRRPKSRSNSPHSPLYSNKTISSSPLSPPSRPLSRTHNRSQTDSPLLSTSNRIEINENMDSIKTETKPMNDSLAFDDSELFEPLSPEDSLSEIAEKISDDENLDQILNEEERSLSQSKCDGFEEISSEEEYEDDGNVDNDLLMDYTDYEFSAYADFGAFNPFQCEFTSLQTLKDPSLSIHELPELENSLDSQNQLKTIELIKSLENQSRNEKWVENIEQIAQEIHKFVIKDDSIISILIDLIVDGICFESALKQSMTAFKVRHLKAGIKLLISLSQTSHKILKRLLDLNLTHELLELYNEPYMTIPVRLLIIRGIDVICDSPLGVEHLIGNKYEWKNQSQQQTCYQKLLDLLMDKPSTRIVVSLTSVLKKIHLFEIISFLAKTNEQQTNAETSNEESIAVCLNEITSTYKSANTLLSQPLRTLPATKQFEPKTSPYDSYKAIYRYFKRHNIIDCITNIVSGKITCSSDTFDSVLDLLNSMSNFQHGLKFLLSCDIFNSTNNLCKVLLQQCDDSETQLQNIGLKLIYRLQVLQLVDMIFTFHSTQERLKSQITDNFDDPDLVATLHSLYSMLFSGIGRDAVVHVLSSEHNFDSILPFITLTGDKKKDALIHKSVSCGCAVELCLVTVQLIDYNIMSFFDNYGQTLLKISENDLIPKLQILSNWLSPIKNISYNVYNENTFKNLLSIIKKHYDLNLELTDNALFSINPELITTLRILQYLCCSTEQIETDLPLKCKYALIQIFSNDFLSQIVFLLNKLSETYLKPSHQSVALIGNAGSLVVNFVKPSIILIKSILTYLVSARASDFKDISPIPVLLRIYSVMALVPTSLLNASIAQQIQYEITEILLIYTELYINATESEEAINKSVWTKMTKHIIDYTLSSPLAFVHGLTVLSDVLPQPLPLLVKHPMFSHESIKTVNFRKLWSLHLHVLNKDIETLIAGLMYSNFQPIQLLLKRVCAQLCDLSAPTVNIVANCVFEAFIQSLETFNYATNDSKSITLCPTVRVLQFIIDLSINTPFKLGFLIVLGNNFKKDDKNGNILLRLHSALNKSFQCSSPQELVNSILWSNADTEVLVSDESNAIITESNKIESITNETNVLLTENLKKYFSSRPAFVLTTQLEDERLALDWFSVPNEDSDQLDFSDSVKIDLLDISVKYFGNDYNIRANLEKLWTEPMIETQTKESEVSEKTNSLPFIRTGTKDIMTANKRILAPRGRGRVFTRINDPFRSRPPNTSRPPSMHVDDFVALERNDNSNTKRINKEFIRPNRGMNTSLRSFGSNIRSSNTNPYRSSPSNTRNIADRYNSRDLHSMSSNRINKSSESNFPLRWNRISGNRYDFRYSQYSRSFPR